MKPSTTTRARTSRCESRATTAGSRAMRSPRARDMPDARAPEPERGSEALTGSAVLRGEGDHRIGVLGERTPIPATEDVPAAEARVAEQELELEAIDPALAGLEAMGAR